MDAIDTPRLRLIPLTMEQLRLYLEDLNALERDLGVRLSPPAPDDPVRRAIEIKLNRMPYATEMDRAWYTYWLIVIGADAFGAGMAGFKGEPDSAGEVEIGYGIDEAYREQGYMTEAVRALVEWAFTHPACHAVKADTRRDNLASQRVLAKAGFRLVRQDDEVTDWRIDRANGQAEMASSPR